MKSGQLLRSIILLSTLLITGGRTAEIQQPLPHGSSNAALHYQRAILLLAGVDPQQRALLQKPVWETVTPQMTAAQQDDVTQLLFGGRHAIRAAMIGSQQRVADFGADLSAYGAALLLPHVGPMEELARLVALYGLHQQGDGHWADAAETYLSVVRMGRHLTEQLTLGESAKGVRILEAGYHCLATWAARCPDRELITATRQAFIAIGTEAVSPLAAVTTEAAIVEMRLAQLEHAYPDGNWPEILLAATNAPASSTGVTDWREFAKSAVIKRGVPAAVFETPDQFEQYLSQMRTTNREFYSRTLAALSLPPEQAIAAGKKVHAEFANRLKRLGDPDALSPAQIVSFYVTHDTARRLLNVTLALCAQREGELFPRDLSGVATTFGGQLPVSPIGRKPVNYRVSSNRKGFRIAFPQSVVADIEIPEVAFEYNMRSAGNK